MKLNILYFGLVAEAVKQTSEELVIDATITVNELQNLLIEKYTVLSNLSYKVAVNKELVNTETLISEDSEIAVLPPFAGG